MRLNSISFAFREKFQIISIKIIWNISKLIFFFNQSLFPAVFFLIYHLNSPFSMSTLIYEKQLSLSHFQSHPVWTCRRFRFSIDLCPHCRSVRALSSPLNYKNSSSIKKNAQTERERSQDKDKFKKKKSTALCYVTPKTALLLHACTDLFWFDLFCLASTWKDIRIHLRGDEMRKIALRFSQLLLSNFVILVTSLRCLFGESNVRELKQKDGRRSRWRWRW